MIKRILEKIMGKQEKEVLIKESNSSKTARLAVMMLIERFGGKLEITDIESLERRYEEYKLTVSKKGRKKILRIRRK